MKHLCLLLLLVARPVLGQLRIIPQPAVVQTERGAFTIRPGLQVWTSPACSTERAFLQTYWREANLPALTVAPKARSADILLLIDTTRREAFGTEGYELVVSSRRIVVTGATTAGIFYGLQTLRQVLPMPLTPSLRSEAVSGSRGPLATNRLVVAQESQRIAGLRVRDKPRFGWRSLTWYESKPVTELNALYTLLDRMALLKFNRLIWSLPAKSANAERQAGYSAEQIRSLRQYAQDRHIGLTVDLGLGQSRSVMTKKASDAFHPTPTTVVHFWRGVPRYMLEAAQSGQELVSAVSEETDLSRPTNDLPLDRVYRYEPIPDQMPESLLPQILGVGYSYEHNGNSLSNPLFPRLAAAAEVTWTFAHNKDLDRFKAGLPVFDKRWPNR